MTPDPAIVRAVEALLFAAEVPLRGDDLARVVSDVTGRDVTPGEADAAVAALNAVLEASGRAVRAFAWGGGWRLATTDEAAPFVQALRQDDQQQRLSRSLLETLAVVAYKQPVTKPEVDHVRGVGSDYAVRQLLERGLVTVVGRGDGIGRPLLYGTTERFLDAFGLGTLSELPAPREIEDLLADPTFNRERIRLLAELGDVAPPPATASDATPAADAQS